jgi:hypothetical protein
MFEIDKENEKDKWDAEVKMYKGMLAHNAGDFLVSSIQHAHHVRDV